MDTKFKKELKEVVVEVFNQGVEELISPRFAELEDNIEDFQKEMHSELSQIKGQLNRIDNKVDLLAEKVNKQDRKILELEEVILPR